MQIYVTLLKYRTTAQQSKNVKYTVGDIRQNLEYSLYKIIMHYLYFPVLSNPE